jgi:hypothetical protein
MNIEWCLKGYRHRPWEWIVLTFRNHSGFYCQDFDRSMLMTTKKHLTIPSQNVSETTRQLTHTRWRYPRGHYWYFYQPTPSHSFLMNIVNNNAKSNNVFFYFFSGIWNSLDWGKGYNSTFYNNITSLRSTKIEKQNLI